MLAAGRRLKNILTPPQAFLDWCFSPLSADVKNRQSQQFLPSRPSAHLTLPSSSFFILFTAPKTLWKPRTIYIENVQFESSWPTQLLQFNLTRISTSISPKDMFWFGCFNPSIFGQNPWDHWPGFTAPWTRNRPTITLSLVLQKDDLLIEKWLTILVWAVFLGCFFVQIALYVFLVGFENSFGIWQTFLWKVISHRWFCESWYCCILKQYQGDCATNKCNLWTQIVCLAGSSASHVYMGSPPPTRWPIFHLVGQLTSSSASHLNLTENWSLLFGTMPPANT